MAYITVSNSKKLLRRIDLKKFEDLQGQVYKNEIYFLSNREKSMLLGIREFLTNPEKFTAEFYNPIEVNDTLRYVYEEQQPAYHVDSSCPRLQSSFHNFVIPEEIKTQGHEKILEFRRWFKENSYTLDKPDVFVMRLNARWGIVTNPQAINYSNTGTEDFSNLSLHDLENKIDNILRDAGKYYRENPEKQQLIKRFGKLTFLAYIQGDIYKNDTGLNDQDLKDFLRFYDETFKHPVRELLIHYYRVLHNPEMTFDGLLLEKLNFRACGACHGKNGIQEDLTPEVVDDLPF